MRKRVVVGLMAVMAIAGSLAFTAGGDIKLPKCSGGLCRDVGCAPDVYCVQGSKVRNCADVCKNG